MRDPQARARFAAAGRQAVLHTYNWENDTARLLTAVQRVCADTELPVTSVPSPVEPLVGANHG
jgi:hypothetical protein